MHEMAQTNTTIHKHTQTLRTRLAPPGTDSTAPVIPANPPPPVNADDNTLTRFTSILSRLETVTDQVQELREKLSKPFDGFDPDAAGLPP